jgi:ABC-type uncharacterized transport system fused permease/ATPase subunit
LAWPLSGAILLIVVLNLLALYAINIWNRGIFDALEKRDAERVFTLALIYDPQAFFRKSAGSWNHRRESLLCVAQLVTR